MECKQAVEVCLLREKELLWLHFTTRDIAGHASPAIRQRRGRKLGVSHEGTILPPTPAAIRDSSECDHGGSYQDIQSTLTVTRVDKSAPNFAFVCKAYYRWAILQRLNSQDDFIRIHHPLSDPTPLHEQIWLRGLSWAIPGVRVAPGGSLERFLEPLGTWESTFLEDFLSEQEFL